MNSTRRFSLGLLLLTAASASAPALADPFKVTYESAGVQNSTSTFDYVGVEDFNSLSNGTGQSFTTNYGTSSTSPYQMTGAYNGVQINSADQYGGAGGSGKYAVTFSNAGYSLNLSATNTATGQAAPVNYFGFWLSALDTGNEISFYNGSSLVYSFSPAQVAALLGNQPAFLGNPNAPFKGQNSSQNYVFLNFYDTVGTFNRIVFSENPLEGGYESDNQTIGYYTGTSGTNVSEPATLAVLMTGLIGLTMLRRRASF